MHFEIPIQMIHIPIWNGSLKGGEGSEVWSNFKGM